MPRTRALAAAGARPVADSDTLEGRAGNRRVFIVVMAHSDEMIRETWAGAGGRRPV